MFRILLSLIIAISLVFSGNPETFNPHEHITNGFVNPSSTTAHSFYQVSTSCESYKTWYSEYEKLERNGVFLPHILKHPQDVDDQTECDIFFKNLFTINLKFYKNTSALIESFKHLLSVLEKENTYKPFEIKVESFAYEPLTRRFVFVDIDKLEMKTDFEISEKIEKLETSEVTEYSENSERSENSRKSKTFEKSVISQSSELPENSEKSEDLKNTTFGQKMAKKFFDSLIYERIPLTLFDLKIFEKYNIKISNYPVNLIYKGKPRKISLIGNINIEKDMKNPSLLTIEVLNHKSYFELNIIQDKQITKFTEIQKIDTFIIYVCQRSNPTNKIDIECSTLKIKKLDKIIKHLGIK